MVVTLGPGKFYGSSLPRPYIYTDVKLSDSRVDPPVSIMDPLMTWAEEAHWSMGGLNMTRHRLQGRIEGNVNKLRAQKEKEFKASSSSSHKQQHKPVKGKNNGGDGNVNATPSPPPAPRVIKRRRVVGLVDEDEEGEEEQRGVVRKLEDDFDRVATRSRSKVEIRKGKRKLVKGGRKVAGIRSSPRLAKSS